MKNAIDESVDYRIVRHNPRLGRFEIMADGYKSAANARKAIPILVERLKREGKHIAGSSFAVAYAKVSASTVIGEFRQYGA